MILVYDLSTWPLYILKCKQTWINLLRLNCAVWLLVPCWPSFTLGSFLPSVSFLEFFFFSSFLFCVSVLFLEHGRQFIILFYATHNASQNQQDNGMSWSMNNSMAQSNTTFGWVILSDMVQPSSGKPLSWPWARGICGSVWPSSAGLLGHGWRCLNVWKS